MEVMNAREARHSFSGLLEQVQRGESVAITLHGRIVAIVVPPPDQQLAWLDRLVVSEPTDTGWAAELDAIRTAERSSPPTDPWTPR